MTDPADAVDPTAARVGDDDTGNGLGAERLFGIVSRTDADRIGAEVLRLNDAVRDAARGRIRFDREPANFLPTLVELADERATTTPASGPVRAVSATPEAADPDAVLDADLSTAGRAIRARRLTSLALASAALRRIERRNPTLNAFVRVRSDAALARARQLDIEADSGWFRGPLHGVPLAHKDCFERPGEPMRVGSRVDGPRSGPIPAAMLARLDVAGAIDLGALNLSEMVAGPTGQNPWFGDCRNARDPERISGGSSSGSATAVAARLVHGSIGSDTGGSIRLPAAMNGVIGLKPTYGRVSRAGCFPRAHSLDCVGPIARTATDAALLLHAIAGYDPRDATSVDLPVPDYGALLATADAGSRFAVLDHEITVHDQVARAFDGFCALAARRYRRQPPRRSAEFSASYALADVISKVEAATLHAEWMRTAPGDYSQAVYSRTEPGFGIPAVRYLEALSARATVLRDFVAQAMADVDVLILPTMPIAVPTRVEADMEGRNRVFGVVTALTSLTRPFNYLGLPVLTMPIGFDAAGMPIGAQLVGRPFGEPRLLAIADRLGADLALGG